MAELNADQLAFVDELIRENMVFEAIRFYRYVTGCGLNQGLEAVDMRQRHLGVSFWGDSLAREKAFKSLYAVQRPVVVIEASWDGDSWGWMIGLSAITQGQSASHSRYTEHGLCNVRGFENQVERAVALGKELAEAAGTYFCLTNEDEFPPIRWWDTQPV